MKNLNFTVINWHKLKFLKFLKFLIKDFDINVLYLTKIIMYKKKCQKLP